MTGLASRLREGARLIGTFAFIDAPAVIEVLGDSWLDFVAVDAEHAQIDRSGIQDLVRAGSAVGASVIVRVPTYESHWIGSALDAGATGIIVPRIGTAAEARAAVAAARYPPVGTRGAGPGRAAGYGARMAPYLASANEDILVALQIETDEGVANLAEILSVPGIDVIFVGPGDLRISLQAFGDEGDARLDAAIANIVRECQARGVRVGTFAFEFAEIEAAAARGMTFFIAKSDVGFLRAGLVEARRQIGG